jgi:hypothetical protein
VRIPPPGPDHIDLYCALFQLAMVTFMGTAMIRAIRRGDGRMEEFWACGVAGCSMGFLLSVIFD